jgi:hypothetical protein
VVNGVEYSSIEAMPPEARAAFRAALAGLEDTDGNGIPDMLERPDPDGSVVVHQSSISLNGREVADLAGLPKPLRSLLQQALGGAAERAPGSPAARPVGQEAPDAPSESREHSLGLIAMVVIGAVTGVLVAGGVWMLGGTDASRATPETWPAFRVGAPFIALVIGTTVVGIGLALWLMANRGEESASQRQALLDGLGRVEQSLARLMLVLLAVAVAIVLVVGGWIIAHMDAGSKSQGGQFYVGLYVLVALGAIAKIYSSTRDRLK